MPTSTFWNLGARMLFRFSFIYLLLYALPFMFHFIPFMGMLGEWYHGLWLMPLDWLGKNVLSLDYAELVKPNGSGDTTYSYLQVLALAGIAAIASIVWSVIDYKTKEYNKLYAWFIVFLRYYLGSALMVYGIVKIIPTQFPFPYLERLTQPYGDSSPMGLLWTFMGYSVVYNVFAGVCEALGGLLLLFRRTVMLGALLSIAVLCNIVILNFTYDVPVKLFSAHLLLAAVIIVLPKLKRLFNFFVLNKAVDQEKIVPIYNNDWQRVVYFSLKGLMIVTFITLNVLQSLRSRAQYSVKPPLHGIYEVDEFVLGQDTLQPLINDTRRWKKMVVSWKDWSSIEYMDGAKMHWRFVPDTIGHRITFMSYDSSSMHHFTYNLDSKIMVMNGSLGGAPIQVKMRRKTEQDFLLVNRGFHWVNEYPFNR